MVSVSILHSRSSRMLSVVLSVALVASLLSLPVPRASAGVVNPDISLIGQPFARALGEIMLALEIRFVGFRVDRLRCRAGWSRRCAMTEEMLRHRFTDRTRDLILEPVVAAVVRTDTAGPEHGLQRPGPPGELTRVQQGAI